MNQEMSLKATFVAECFANCADKLRRGDDFGAGMSFAYAVQWADQLSGDEATRARELTAAIPRARGYAQAFDRRIVTVFDAPEVAP